MTRKPVITVRRSRVVIAMVAALTLLAPIGLAAADDEHADVPPPGANNWSCRSTTHPVPVILAHGTGANQNENWRMMTPDLVKAGYCVYTTTVGGAGLPGRGGLGPLAQSVKEFAPFVRTVLRRTGSDKIDFVGHSQGATIQMSFLRDYDGAKHARRVINLAGVVAGPVTLFGLAPLLGQPVRDAVKGACAFCGDMLDPNAFKFTNYPNIEYVNIASDTDEVVNPPSVSFMKLAPNVRNVLVQSYCPGMIVGHDAMSKNPTVRRIILNSLDPATRQPVKCGPNDPL